MATAVATFCSQREASKVILLRNGMTYEYPKCFDFHTIHVKKNLCLDRVQSSFFYRRRQCIESMHRKNREHASARGEKRSEVPI